MRTRTGVSVIGIPRRQLAPLKRANFRAPTGRLQALVLTEGRRVGKLFPGGETMPIYEYRCEKCGHVSSFMEKMFERPRFFGAKRRCEKCRGKKLVKIPSGFGVSVERTQNEMLNELKSMGNVQINTQPQAPQPPPPTGPPGGKCPYCGTEEKKDDKPQRESIEVS
jgi:putative FmdB family regulatory protein